MANTLPKHRKNGFQCPLHPYQIVSWLVFALVVLGSVYLLGIIMPKPYQFLYYIGIGLVELCVVVSAGITTFIDPADPLNCPNIEDGKYCYMCRKRVKRTTEHCRPCNKCIEEYDHHCKWLNTCIGKKNYRFFFATLVSVSCLCFFQVTLSIVMLIIVYAQPSIMISLFRTVSWPSYSLVSYQVCLYLFIAINVSLLYYVLELLILHIKLYMEGETTYSHIIRLERKEKESKKRKVVSTPTLKERNSSNESVEMHITSVSVHNEFEETPHISSSTPSPMHEAEDPTTLSPIRISISPTTTADSQLTVSSSDGSPIVTRDDSSFYLQKVDSFSSVDHIKNYSSEVVYVDPKLDQTSVSGSPVPERSSTSAWNPSKFNGFHNMNADKVS